LLLYLFFLFIYAFSLLTLFLFIIFYYFFPFIFFIFFYKFLFYDLFHLGHLALLMGGAGNRRRLRSMNDRVRDARAYLHLSMIFSENRYPLFGIMLLSTSPPPRQPLISRAAGARVMTEQA